MNMNIEASLRGSTALRGIGALRAEGGAPTSAEVKALVDGVQKAFADFKTANDERLKQIEAKGAVDPVTAEKVEKINSELDKLGKELDSTNTRVALMAVGGTGTPASNPRANTPEAKAHAKAFNDYFRKGIDATLRDLEVKASLSEGSGPDGGYTVPIDIDYNITRILAKVSAMRRLAQVMQISTLVYRKPISLGGAGSGWVGETEPRPQTNTPSLSVIDFPAMELYAMPAATQSLLDDSAVNIADWLATEVQITFAEQEGLAFISGNSADRPKGILSYATVADANYAWGKIGYVATGAAADFAAASQADALIDLAYAPKQGYRQNGSFLSNRKTLAAIRKFKDSTGNYVWQPGLVAGEPGVLLGYPHFTDDNMPDIGAGAYPVAFGDFARGYLIVDRIGVRVLRDPYSAKPYVLFYTTKRVGGGVQNFEAIKLLKVATS
jgi:HK97 family phage major capsid protein